MKKPQIVLWTSIQGLKNMEKNKKFYAYSKSSKIDNLQVILPTQGIEDYEDQGDMGIQFLFHEKRFWELCD